jgi:hypothetical protein
VSLGDLNPLGRNTSLTISMSQQILPGTITLPRFRQPCTLDENIFIPTPSLRRFSRTLTTLLATLILLTPVVILSGISSQTARLATVFLSAAFFLSAVSLFTDAKTVELFTAGAR